ncbi:extracellular solute-binding protein [Paenibacillus doosanensis]|uniref:extracellular solute-binding protein n=1 Tax=Paenibacillus doosanensis TaxID=1229154 RepID=UPI00217F832A|nr:extracellular solute-binding protein [Paenibacillus doosanensis]MCS7459852.1 extracellular solute-binding protein [Paenibacillus doosanensis]
MIRKSIVWKNWQVYSMILPGVLFFVIFRYIPIAGNVIAFQDYNVFSGVTGSPFVGLKHFEHLFAYPEFSRILRNTLLISLYQLIFGFSAPIILSLLLNEVRKMMFKRVVPNLIRSQMKTALELHRSLYKEQLMDNEIFVQQGKDWDAKIKGAARVGMWVHDPSYPDKWQSEVRQTEPSSSLINIPAPVGPDGKGGTGLSSSVGNVWAIPKSNKNPEAAIKFLDWFYSDEAQKFLDYGLENEDYTVENSKIQYKYATTVDAINKENMHLMFLRLVGPSYLANEEFMKGRKDSDLILNALSVAKNEGRVNDGVGMPITPTMLSKPELGKNGLWMEMAAKIITGKEPIDSFDKFVEDWKKRGGDQIIKEATEWYNSKNKK